MSPKMPPKSRAHNDHEAKRGNVHGDGLAVSASASFSTNEFSNRMSKKEKIISSDYKKILLLFKMNDFKNHQSPMYYIYIDLFFQMLLRKDAHLIASVYLLS